MSPKPPLALLSLWALVIVGLLAPQPGGCITGAEYRRMAEAAVRSRQYDQAARYYRLEAQVYRQRGDLNGAAVEEMKAERWTTEIHLFTDLPPDRQALLGLYSGAKFEPVYGCYLGAYVSGDTRLNGGPSEWGNVIYANRAESLGALINRHLATSWDYCTYGSRFPLRWARALTHAGIAPHIAWEPNNGLHEVRDDAYLQRFARDAAACGGPVFLRFAGEMNGSWTAWHNDPALYRASFRLVHDVMARAAPNVAMIWCVNQVPEYNMDQYYPGDAYVDWVGVNLYSVIHHNNNPAFPAWFENPASLLKYVYHKYAARKPIAICEYGSSHQERLDPRFDYSEIASSKFAELFASLPREFPRVKLIGIFDNDNLTGANVLPARQLNNYCITDSQVVLAALTQAVASNYFLPTVLQTVQKELPTYTRGLGPGTMLRGTVRLSAWVKTYEDRPAVVYSLDGKPAARLTSPGEYRIDLDTTRYNPGNHLLSVDVFDSHGQLAGRREVPVYFSSPPPTF